jgi:hypothetical protein
MEDSRGSHGHSVDISASGATGDPDDHFNVGGGSAYGAPSYYHHHPFNVRVTGSTAGVGDHNHNTDGYTDGVDQYPPWYSVVYCRKD